MEGGMLVAGGVGDTLVMVGDEVGEAGKLVLEAVRVGGNFVFVGVRVGTIVLVGVGAGATLKDHQLVLPPLPYVVPAAFFARTCQ
jgi:hypothetical protein